TLGPFKIIYQSPEKHASYIEAIANCLMNRAQMVEQKLWALCILRIGQTSFGYINWQTQPRNPPQSPIQTLRIDLTIAHALKANIALRPIGMRKALAKHLQRLAPIKAYKIPRIVI